MNVIDRSTTLADEVLLVCTACTVLAVFVFCVKLLTDYRRTGQPIVWRGEHLAWVLPAVLFQSIGGIFFISSRGFSTLSTAVLTICIVHFFWKVHPGRIIAFCRDKALDEALTFITEKYGLQMTRRAVRSSWDVFSVGRSLRITVTYNDAMLTGVIRGSRPEYGAVEEDLLNHVRLSGRGVYRKSITYLMVGFTFAVLLLIAFAGFYIVMG